VSTFGKNGTNINVKLSTVNAETYGKKTYRKLEACLRSFLTFSLDESQWSVPNPARYTPTEVCTGTIWLWGWVGPISGTNIVWAQSPVPVRNRGTVILSVAQLLHWPNYPAPETNTAKYLGYELLCTVKCALVQVDLRFTSKRLISYVEVCFVKSTRFICLRPLHFSCVFFTTFSAFFLTS
jgi:hypothetical protein